MRIILADDQPQVRSALRLLIEQECGFTVVAEAETARDLVAKLQATVADAVLLDWELPGVRAVHLVPVLRSIVPGLLIVALSGRPETQALALPAGADAFVSKGGAPETLIATLLSLQAHPAK